MLIPEQTQYEIRSLKLILAWAMAVPWISKYYYLLISFLAYTAIELFGRKYFNFH